MGGTESVFMWILLIVLRFRSFAQLALWVPITFHKTGYRSVGNVHVTLEPHRTLPAFIYVISKVNLYHFGDRRSPFALIIILSEGNLRIIIHTISGQEVLHELWRQLCISSFNLFFLLVRSLIVCAASRELLSTPLSLGREHQSVVNGVLLRQLTRWRPRTLLGSSRASSWWRRLLQQWRFPALVVLNFQDMLTAFVGIDVFLLALLEGPRGSCPRWL